MYNNKVRPQSNNNNNTNSNHNLSITIHHGYNKRTSRVFRN